mmetsp:Transcript_28365/g.39032  ORF Transcript_28365/g.39032 Transcript_28365/m.39032 type:complete len:338 (+) Transcript_28365:3-1016(+)
MMKPTTFFINRLSKGVVKRILLPFSTATNVSAPSTSITTLPSNLVISDTSIFQSLPEVRFPADNYLFPTLDVPENIRVLSFNGKGVGSVAPMERRIFEVAIRKDIVHDVIRYIRHKKRQPKKTKRMSEIAGSNKKPRPQKGTGSSQVGHRRNSAWRKGQKAHGPVLRDYSISINRKVRALGMMMALAAKFREGNLYVFDELKCETLKTKDLMSLLKSHGLDNDTLLVVDEEFDSNFLKAISNVVKAVPLQRKYMTVYEIVKKDKLVMTSAVFADLQRRVLAQYTKSSKRNNWMRALQTLNEANEFVVANIDEDDDDDSCDGYALEDALEEEEEEEQK